MAARKVHTNKKRTGSRASTASRLPYTRKQVVAVPAAAPVAEGVPVAPAGSDVVLVAVGARKPGPKRSHRKEITLPPTVVDAVAAHAKSLGVAQTEYHKLAVAAYFKNTLVDPPAPLVATCPTCGKRTREVEKTSAFRRVRVGVRFDGATVQFLESIADDYFMGTWSRAFEAAMRLFLGDKNPPPEGYGKVPGEKQKSGRPSKAELAERARNKRVQKVAAAAGVDDALAAAERAGKGQ